MMPTLLVVGALLVLLLTLSTVVQTLYLESLRLRARELPALALFRESLEASIGPKDEEGALTFSIIKHTSILLLGLVFIIGQGIDGPPKWQEVVEACVLSWVTLVVAAYILPQALYRRTSGRWLEPLAPLLRAMAIAARPLTAVLGFFLSLVDLTNGHEEKEESASPTDEIEALISAGAEEGIIEEEDRRLIHSAVAFGDKTVRDVMTPRPNIVAIEVNRSLEDLREMVINEQYSRIPVYDSTIDSIIGFVHVRDMFELDDEERSRKTVRDLMRSIRSVPETKPASDLLREMQEDGAHMVAVVDEYGGTAGLATMEDLVEELVGEIRDEHEPASDVIRDSSGAFVVSGSYDVDNLRELVNFEPTEGTESTTVGGLVTEWMGRVPHVGEAVEREGIRIEVLAGNELRVDQVRISRIPEKTVHA